MNMNITDIKIRRLLQEGRLRAVVSVTVDNELAIHDIKVIEGPERLFVAMPSRKELNGVFRDIVHPISPAARWQFEQSILNAYQRELAARHPQETMHPSLSAGILP
jgi:stage V sporulation protein G